MSTEPRYRGFTLIELMIVLAVLGVLATVVIPVVELDLRRSREAELRRALWELRDAIDAYRAAVDRGQILQQADHSGYPPSIEVLVQGVNDATRPGQRMHFLRRIPRDPMRPEVNPAEAWGLRSYASPHDRPMPGDDVYDVYSQAAGTGLDGRPYRTW